jgi:hypothetical protein
MLKRRTKWLDRRIAAPGPYLCLCLSEPEFKAAVAHLKAPTDLDWIKTPQADATAHTFDSPSGGLTVVVCLQGAEGRNPVEVAGLLVHEAVHAWQAYADHIGERNPGIEQEAYAIQSIAQELMAEFARRMGATC